MPTREQGKKNRILSIYHFLLIGAFVFPNQLAFSSVFDYGRLLDDVEHCIRKPYYRICRIAFDKVNRLQLRAEKHQNYSCQTRLLGLESNLILAMNNKLKKHQINKILKEVRTFC